MNAMTRVWIPYESHIEIPEEILDIFDQTLGIPEIHYWSNVITPSDDYRELHGLIVVQIWLDREKYKRHDEPIMEVPIGYWHDHPFLKGAWYYYFESAEVHRRLQRALIDADQKMHEGEGEGEGGSA